MPFRRRVSLSSFKLPALVVLSIATISLIPSPVYGQTALNSTGAPPLGSFTSGPDQLNLGNLNNHFPVPVFSKAQRGMTFNYVLSFDNTIWLPGTSWSPLPNWGWRGISEASTGYISRDSINENCGLSPQGGVTPNFTTEPRFINFQYHDAFGVVHGGFSNTAGGCPGDGLTNTSVSTDMAGYTLDTTTAGQWNVRTPLGVTIFPPVGPNPGSGKVIDRNGNELTNNLTTFTDTLGVTALTVSPSGSNPTVYTYTTSSGAPASVTVNYSSQTVQTNFGCPGVAEYGPQSTNLVSSIILPDSSSYSFTYEPTPGVAGAVTGRIHGITLPTGGTITYNYTGPNNGIECVDGTTSGMDRVTSDGTVSYTRSGAGSSWTTTILDASTPRNATTINFQSAGSVINFYETHRVVNQGPSTVLMQTDTCYNGATPPCSGTGITLPISEVKRYITLNNGFQGLTDTFLNSLGLPTD